MKTHESYCSFETANLLKQAGFDWECMSYYENRELERYTLNGKGLVIMNFNANPNYMFEVSAPTLDVAQRWLREVKKYWANVSYHDDGWNPDGFPFYEWEIKSPFMSAMFISGRSRTYEQALEAGINKCLTILLEEKK